MKTKTELEKDIINITMSIYRKFPELYHTDEMPVIVSGTSTSGESSKNLEAYYHTLEAILSKHTKILENKKLKNG